MSGGQVGGGVGATLGGIAAAALAPETGGASLLADAALTAAGSAVGGAAGGAAGAAATGGNPGQSALSGGITGGVGGLAGGVLSGLLSPAADGATDALDATGTDPLTSGATTETGAGLGNTSSVLSTTPGAAAGDQSASADLYSGSNSLGTSGGVGVSAPSSAPSSVALPTQTPTNGGSWMSNLFGGASSNSAGNVAGNGAGSAAKGSSSGLSSYLVPAGIGLSALNALMPSGSNPVNTSALSNAQNLFNAPLPKYNYNSVQTPYTGSWYTYGQRPEAPLVQNTITPAARGGLMKGYSRGGQVRHLAMGGLPMPPQGMAPQQQMPQQGQPQIPQRGPNTPPANPLQQALQFRVGQKIGQALRRHIRGMTPDGQVRGAGKGQDDAIPAKLSQGEYVVPAEVVSQLGDGSTDAGGKELDKMVHHVRAHKTSHGSKFPPKAHNPLSYIHKGGK